MKALLCRLLRMQAALKVKLFPKDSSRLLDLVGVVTEASRNARDHAEDEY